MKYKLFGLIALLAILLVGGYFVLLSQNIPQNTDKTVNTNEGSLLVLWSDNLGFDLRVATMAIFAILFCGTYGTLYLLKEEET